MTGTIKHFSLKKNCSSEDCICVKMSNICASLIILLTCVFLPGQDVHKARVTECIKECTF